MKIKQIHLWSLIILSLVVLFFNTSLYLNYAVSMKYEVEHPMMMAEEITESMINREREITQLLNFSRLIYLFSFLTIGTSIYLLISDKKVL